MSAAAQSPISGLAAESAAGGPFFIGAMLTAILWGVSSVQFFIFFNNESKERRVVRLLLCILWVVDTFHLASAIQAGYSSSVLNSANSPWGISGAIIASVATVAIVDGLYIYRIWTLTRRTVWIACLSIDVFIACALLLTYAISLFYETTAGAKLFLNACFFPGTALTAAADFSIAFTLVYSLYQSKTIRGSRARSAVHFFRHYTLNTGLITSIVTFLVMVTGLSESRHFTISTDLGLIVNGLYVNSLLGALNAREKFRNADNVVFMQTLSTLADDPESQRPRFETRAPGAATDNSTRMVISVQKSELKAEL